MDKVLGVFIVVLLCFGCARVRVEAPKEPIKVDISMRLDIYQHIEKDIDAIENIVSGAKDKSKPVAGEERSFLLGFVGVAYAEEVGPEVEAAALRRKDRIAELISWEQRGIVGENKLGLVEVRSLDNAKDAVNSIVQDENRDRMVIYRALANKNNVPVEDIQKLYAKRLQSDAPAGTPIEIVDGTTGRSSWQMK
jgi:uncharacterized protein YdbL (DUF1318 family)